MCIRDRAEKEKDNDWYLYIKKYFRRVVVFGGLMLAIAIFGIHVAEPALSGYMSKTAADTLTCVSVSYTHLKGPTDSG